MEYSFNAIEKKWQERWKADQVYKVHNDSSKPKCYVLDMFPYPSGSGLHVGHWRGYVLSDVYARIKWLEGYNVLHPMGWDAFGLPAENAAIAGGIHPAVWTADNITTMRTQLQRMGFGYAELAKINPRIICAFGSGFGQAGPLSYKGGQDILAQALSGVMRRKV